MNNTTEPSLCVLNSTIAGAGTSIMGSAVGSFVDDAFMLTSKAQSAYTQYLSKSFGANIRKSAGKSYSSLMRQANKFLTSANYYENVARGVSSVVGSFVSVGCGVFE